MMRDEIAAGRILAALRHGRLSRREALRGFLEKA
jgi:hypothetical protein